MKEKLQNFEISTFIYFIIRSSYIGIGIQCYLNISKVDGYLCPIIGTIIGFIPLLIYLKIVNDNPNKNILEINEDKFHNQFFNFILMISIFFFSMILTYDLVRFVSNEALDETPTYFIYFSLLIPIIYLLSKGLKVIARTSIILFFISIILFILSFTGLIFQINISNIFPILENGINKSIIGSLYHICYSILPLFILTIIPRDKVKSKNFSKNIISSYLLVNLTIFLATFCVISVMGIDLASLYQYPDYQILRRISIGSFIQRIESILGIQWLICIILMITLCNYYVITSFNHIFKIKNKKITNFIIPIILSILTIFMFKNNTIADNFLINIYPFILVTTLFFIPCIIALKNNS